MANIEYSPSEMRRRWIKKLRRNQEKYEESQKEGNKRIKKDRIIDEEEDEEKNRIR